jgi:hypothetical protein
MQRFWGYWTLEHHMSKRKPNHGDIEAARHGIARSPKWRAVEKKYLKENPICVACGKKTKFPLQVHHVHCFHVVVALGRPDLELDPRNLLTLCEDEAGRKSNQHHLLVGHLNSFRSANINALTDARKTFKGMTKKQIEVSPKWLALVKTRLKALDEMTAAEKKALRADMDRDFPLVKKS